METCDSDYADEGASNKIFVRFGTEKMILEKVQVFPVFYKAMNNNQKKKKKRLRILQFGSVPYSLKAQTKTTKFKRVFRRGAERKKSPLVRRFEARKKKIMMNEVNCHFAPPKRPWKVKKEGEGSEREIITASAKKRQHVYITVKDNEKVNCMP